MENFVRDYGTGNQIPDPPAFINYNMPDAIPSSSSRRTTHPAQFVRATQRELPLQNTAELDSEEPVVNTAGIGAGGGRRSELYTEPPDLTRRPTQSRAQAQQAVYVNGVSNNQPAYGVSPPTLGPRGNLLRENLLIFHRRRHNVPDSAFQRIIPVNPIDNGCATVDPLAKQLEELRKAVSSSGSA